MKRSNAGRPNRQQQQKTNKQMNSTEITEIMLLLPNPKFGQ